MKNRDQDITSYYLDQNLIVNDSSSILSMQLHHLNHTAISLNSNVLSRICLKQSILFSLKWKQNEKEFDNKSNI